MLLETIFRLLVLWGALTLLSREFQQGELNVDVDEVDAAKILSKWVQDRWDGRWGINITDELVEIIENSRATEKLSTVKDAAHHLHHRGGVIIGDVVGLGKSWQQESDWQYNAFNELISNTHKDEKILIFKQFSDLPVSFVEIDWG